MSQVMRIANGQHSTLKSYRRMFASRNGLQLWDEKSKRAKSLKMSGLTKKSPDELEKDVEIV